MTGAPPRNRVVAAALVTLVVLVGSVAVDSRSSASASQPPGSLRSAPALANRLLLRVNALRAQVGVPPLVRDAGVDAVALNWSATMARGPKLAHNAQLGAQLPAGWIRAGENVGVGQDIDRMFDEFVASPHHYPNMVDRGFSRTGIAVLVDADGMLWVTQDFEAVGAWVSGTSRTAPSTTSTTALPPPPPPPAPRVPARLSFALQALSGAEPSF